MSTYALQRLLLLKNSLLRYSHRASASVLLLEQHACRPPQPFTQQQVGVPGRLNETKRTWYAQQLHMMLRSHPDICRLW
jgi:hypothetical protein